MRVSGINPAWPYDRWPGQARPLGRWVYWGAGTRDARGAK